MTLIAHRGRCPRCGSDPQGDAEFRAAVTAIHGPRVPAVEDLLVLAVECRVIRMSQVMDPELQATLAVSLDTMSRYLKTPGKLPKPDVNLNSKKVGWKVSTLHAAGVNVPA